MWRGMVRYGQLLATAGYGWLRLAGGMLDVAADGRDVAAIAGRSSGGEEGDQ